MEVGSLKYTFDDLDGVRQTVIIPKSVFAEARRINLEKNAAIRLYLKNAGYRIEMPKRAEGDLLNTKSAGGRSRKANPTKREIIAAVANVIETKYGAADVTNPERIVAFEIDGQKYELTLTAKRK